MSVIGYFGRYPFENNFELRGVLKLRSLPTFPSLAFGAGMTKTLS